MPDPRDTIGAVPDTSRPWDRSPPRPDTLPIPPFSDTLSFEEFAVRELIRLDPALTPADWRQRYPADSLDRFVDGSGDLWAWWDLEPYEGSVCARARRRVPLADGRIALRTALFHPPVRSSGVDLPEVRDTLGLDLTGCRLGAVWISVPLDIPPLWRASAADSARMREGLRGVRFALTRHLGEPDQEGGRFLPRGWTGEWVGASFWRHAGVSQIVLYEPFDAELRVGAWTPSSGVEIGPVDQKQVFARTDRSHPWHVVRAADLDSLMADTLLELAQRAYLSHWGMIDGKGPSEAVLAEALEEWLRGSDGLSPTRRAAVLLVAHHAITLAFPSVDSTERAGVAPLERLGAEYGHNEMGASYDYMGNWLKDAYRLGEEGPVGELSFLLLLRRAFEAFSCTHDEEAFRIVIDRGEEFLARHPGSPIVPKVALEVARAYADVVALASEIDTVAESYVDGAPYREEAPKARRTALRYYRLALSGLTDPALAEEAWQEAWRLAAGMPPAGTSYVYICD